MVARQVEMEENRLIRLARNGDLQAFNTLVLGCQDDAYTLACYLAGDEALASAGVQAGVLRAWREIHRFQAGTFRAWLLSCVAGTCPSSGPVRRNGQASRRSMEDLPGELSRSLASLSPECRLALLLVDLLGLDFSEAVHAAGCSQAKFTQHLASARSRLAARLSN